MLEYIGNFSRLFEDVGDSLDIDIDALDALIYDTLGGIDGLMSHLKTLDSKHARFTSFKQLQHLLKGKSRRASYLYTLQSDILSYNTSVNTTDNNNSSSIVE